MRKASQGITGKLETGRDGGEAPREQTFAVHEKAVKSVSLADNYFRACLTQIGGGAARL
jgi:hypothetical protein